MNRKWLVFVGLSLAAVAHVRADALQFTNITSLVSLGATNHLAAVTYGGGASFVAVGTNSIALVGSLGPNAFPSTNVAKSAGFGAISNLTTVAYGNGIYVASGTSNIVFTSANGSQWATNNKAFPYTFDLEALAYNNVGSGPVFAAVSQGLGITYAPATLPLVWSTNITFTNTFNPGNQASLYEGYRAVTPFGSSGFIACGVGGVIRQSTDGGATWNLVRPYDFQAAGLFGIATAGTQTVSVGAKAANGLATILVNSGVNITNWISITNASVPRTNLNAITYTGSEFIAVGDGGTVITSLDGTNWQVAAVQSATPANLSGAFFVSTNVPTPLAGVVLLTGSGGTLVLGGTPPFAPTTNSDGSSSQSACAGTVPPIPLSVNVSNTPANPSVTVDWFDAPTGGHLLASGTTTFAPIAPAAGSTNYYAADRDTRTGLRSTNRTQVTLTANPLPTAAISGSSTSCSGDTAQVVTTMGGSAGPWQVTYFISSSANGPTSFVQTNLTATVTNDFVLTVSGTNAVTNTYTITGVMDLTTFCQASVAGLPPVPVVVVANPRPTATVTSGTQTVCSGNTVIVSAALTGRAPWTVIWSDGTSQFASNGVVSSPALLRVNLTNLTTNAITNFYSVVGLSDANSCIANTNNLFPGDLTGTNIAIVSAFPAPPASPVDAVTCPGLTPYPPLSVTVPAGVSVNWYDSHGALVRSGTDILAPVGPSIPTNSAGSNITYFAEAVSNGGCANTNRTRVTLTVKDCSTPLAIQLISTNVVLSWPGDRALQITNALPQGTDTNGWVTIATGVFGQTNFWTNGTGGFGSFFRLYPFP